MLKKRFIVSIVFLLISLSISIYAASLPSQGGNNNDWGSTLNDFLQVAHDSGGNIRGSYITSAMIIDSTIAAGDFGVGQINSTHIEDSSVHGVDIWNDSIDSIDIRNNSIASGDIRSSQINSTHILDSTIASIDIANDSISAGDIAPGAVNITHFGAITQINTTHIADGTITGNDINPATHINITALRVGNITSSGSNITQIVYSGLGTLTIATNNPGVCNTAGLTIANLSSNALCFIDFDFGYRNATFSNMTLTRSSPQRGAEEPGCYFEICNIGANVISARTYNHSFMAITFTPT